MKKCDEETIVERVLAVDPCNMGFGYVVVEGPERLIDRGVVFVTGEKNSKCLRRFSDLIHRYEPEVVVLEDHVTRGARRHWRTGNLLAAMRRLASDSCVSVWAAPRRTMTAVFARHGARNKDDIARVVAERFPELAPKLPPRRKIWMSETPTIRMFEAAAYALTYFELRNRPGGSQKAA